MRVRANRFGGQPLGVRGIQKRVERYRRGAGIEKRNTPHSLWHTLVTHQATGCEHLPAPSLDGARHRGATTQLSVFLGQEEPRTVMEQTSFYSRRPEGR